MHTQLHNQMKGSKVHLVKCSINTLRGNLKPKINKPLVRVVRVTLAIEIRGEGEKEAENGKGMVSCGSFSPEGTAVERTEKMRGSETSHSFDQW